MSNRNGASGASDEQVVKVASGGTLPAQEVAERSAGAGAQPDQLAALMAEVQELRSKLALSEEKRDEAEKAALAAAEAQGVLMQRAIQEVATGKRRKVKRAIGYEVTGYIDGGREVLKPKWGFVDLPTYFYKIDMPPVGGEALAINGIQLYHGMVYELDIDTLRTVKEIVYRLWDHDRAIHGTDENFYRKPQERVLSARGGA